MIEHRDVQMKRRDKITRMLDLQKEGLEIGPFYNPLVPKRLGYNVRIVDSFTTDELRAKQPEKAANIEEVDFVWSGQTYAELTGKKNHYAWVIASHVIEHSPDLVGFLNSCSEVLREDGLLALAIPDKRYCFDHFRQSSGLGNVIDAIGRTQATKGMVFEHYRYWVSMNGKCGWDASSQGKLKRKYSYREAQDKMNNKMNEKQFVHSWCFTPSSFRLIIRDLFDLGLSPFCEYEFYDTDGCEFIIVLGKNKELENKTVKDDLLQRMRTEV